MTIITKMTLSERIKRELIKLNKRRRAHKRGIAVLMKHDVMLEQPGRVDLYNRLHRKIGLVDRCKEDIMKLFEETETIT